MSLRSPESMKTKLALPFRHSRMLLAGIQAKSGLDPRLKHSGVTIWELAPLSADLIFEGGAKDAKVRKISTVPAPRVFSREWLCEFACASAAITGTALSYSLFTTHRKGNYERLQKSTIQHRNGIVG